MGCLARQSISLGVPARLSIDRCRDRIVIHSRGLTGPIDTGANDAKSAQRVVDKAVETVDSRSSCAAPRWFAGGRLRRLGKKRSADRDCCCGTALARWVRRLVVVLAWLVLLDAVGRRRIVAPVRLVR